MADSPSPPVWRRAPGCTVGLAVTAILTVINHRVLAPVEEPWRVSLALASAFSLYCGLATFWGLARGLGRGERSREAILRRARSGELPGDGEPVIATGRVRALGAPLIAPLSGLPCVAYQYGMYEIVAATPDSDGMRPVYWGYGSRAFALDTPGTRVSVLVVPFLNYPGEDHAGSEAIARARRLLETAPFKSAPRLMQAGSFEQVRGALIGEHEEARHDWKREGEERDPAALQLWETLLPVDAVASVCGAWSAERSGLVAESSGPVASLSPRGRSAPRPRALVVLGPPEDLLAYVRAFRPISYLVSAILATALGVGIVWYGLRATIS